jgi:hypothetical protein
MQLRQRIVKVAEGAHRMVVLIVESERHVNGRRHRGSG